MKLPHFLTPRQVRAIRASLAKGTPAVVLAKRYGRHRDTIADIKNGRTHGGLK